MAVEAWFRARRTYANTCVQVETIATLGDAFGNAFANWKALQLPFRATEHWIAVEYPGTSSRAGKYLSLAQCVPATGFDPRPHKQDC